eukprot:Hpha_TRINITY_DN16548_c1_g1::TRINITY_DN16548_c1_g1_i13::g.133418::m.133418
MLVLVTVNSSDLLHPEVRAPNALPVGALQTVTEDGRDHGDQRLGDLARRNFNRVLQLHGDVLLQHLLNGIRRRLVTVGDFVSLGQLLARVQHRARRLCVRDPPRLKSLLLVQARLQRAPLRPPAPERSVPSLLLSMHQHHLVLVVHPAGTVGELERQHVGEDAFGVTSRTLTQLLDLANRLLELIVLHLQVLLLLLNRREPRRRRRRPVVEENRLQGSVPLRLRRCDHGLFEWNPRRHRCALSATLVTTLLAHFVRLALLLVVELPPLVAALITLTPVLLSLFLSVTTLLHFVSTHFLLRVRFFVPRPTNRDTIKYRN